MTYIKRDQPGAFVLDRCNEDWQIIMVCRSLKCGHIPYRWIRNDSKAAVNEQSKCGKSRGKFGCQIAFGLNYNLLRRQSVNKSDLSQA